VQVQLGKRTEAGCTWRGLRRWSSIEGSELLLDPLLVSHHLSHEGLLLRRWKVRHLLHRGLDLLLLLLQGLLHLLRVLLHLLWHWARLYRRLRWLGRQRLVRRR